MSRWEDFIAAKLVKSPSFEEEGATEDLVHLPEDNGLVRAFITEKSPFIGASLSESGLSENGLLVLGIERGKNWIALPKAKETIQEGDRIVVYGPLEVSRELFKKE
ncbi:MAG: TrkA C-terminal domain-containing protein [Methanophagales archaeon]|nr:TrkA C-terminal domain-containing protein [Methanophagales archaeon]